MHASCKHSNFRSTAAMGRLLLILLVCLAFRPITTEAFLHVSAALPRAYYSSSSSVSCAVRNACGSTRIKLSSSSSNNNNNNDQDPFNEPDQQPKPTSKIRRLSSKLRTGVSRVAGRGGSDVVQSVAETAWTGVNKIASRGGSDVKSMTRNARSGLSSLSRRAGSATSSLQTALQQGQTNTVSVLQWLDSQAKDGVSTTNAKAKDIVLQFTGKSDYVFGDITRELVQRTKSSNVSLQDLLLLLKIFLTVGASFTPLAKLLPLTVLLDMLNVSLEARIGGKLLEVLAESLDDRFRAAFTAEELGDLAKRSLIVGITAFTGKERYEAGDIERAVKKEEVVQQLPQDGGTTVEAINSTGSTPTNTTPAQQQQLPRQPTTKTLNLRLDPEFEAWDAAFRDSHAGDWEMAIESSLNNSNQINSKTLDMEIISELDEWDRKFERMDSR